MSWLRSVGERHTSRAVPCKHAVSRSRKSTIIGVTVPYRIDSASFTLSVIDFPSLSVPLSSEHNALPSPCLASACAMIGICRPVIKLALAGLSP